MDPAHLDWPLVRRAPLEDVRVVADELVFPESPIAMSDGSVLVVEIRRGTLTRVNPDGSSTVVATCGDGPNAAALGPDGAAYVCNNGGRDRATKKTGRVQRVDIGTGEVQDLYRECDGRGLLAPSDLVFDSSGGMWFTDGGITREREVELGSVYYATADGSAITEAVSGVETANGIALSPDEEVLYYCQTRYNRVVRRQVVGPGMLTPSAGLDIYEMAVRGGLDRDSLLVGLPSYQPVDGLAVDADGWVAVATLWAGCITAVSPDGSTIEQYLLPDEIQDRFVTNICFGGPDLRTAYLTLSGTGRLVACRWPRTGLAVPFSV